MHRLVVALLGLLQARGAVSAETYHDVLGLGPNSALGAAELKSAYRKRSLELHPDKPGGSVDRFRLLQEAYETLKDEQSRKYYAAFGMVWKQVKEYQEKYLTGRRQVIQRTRYGMWESRVGAAGMASWEQRRERTCEQEPPEERLAIEEFEIREPMGDIWAGARLNVVPMHGERGSGARAWKPQSLET